MEKRFFEQEEAVAPTDEELAKGEALRLSLLALSNLKAPIQNTTLSLSSSINVRYGNAAADSSHDDRLLVLPNAPIRRDTVPAMRRDLDLGDKDVVSEYGIVLPQNEQVVAPFMLTSMHLTAAYDGLYGSTGEGAVGYSPAWTQFAENGWFRTALRYRYSLDFSVHSFAVVSKRRLKAAAQQLA